MIFCSSNAEHLRLKSYHIESGGVLKHLTYKMESLFSDPFMGQTDADALFKRTVRTSSPIHAANYAESGDTVIDMDETVHDYRNIDVTPAVKPKTRKTVNFDLPKGLTVGTICSTTDANSNQYFSLPSTGVKYVLPLMDGAQLRKLTG